MQQVALKPPCGVFSSNAATVLGNVAGSRGEGFVLTPGTFKRPVLLATMWGFSAFGVKIQVRPALQGPADAAAHI